MMTSGLFNFSDKAQMASLAMRMQRSLVINANVTNAETPGYRALGYEFEEQLQTLLDSNIENAVATNNPKHLKHKFVSADGSIRPDVFVRPTESVGHDGNTVDIDKEMARKSVKRHPCGSSILFDVNDAEMRAAQIEKADVLYH